MTERLKSIPLWAAVLSLIYLICKNWYGIELQAWTDISSEILAILAIMFGIANDPTNRSGF